MAALSAIGGLTFLPLVAAGNKQSVATFTPFALVALVATLAWQRLA